MKDQSKTKQELLKENALLKQRIQELEQSAAGCKRAEEALYLFKGLVEHSSVAIGMSTPEGRHYYQNETFDRLFGDIGDHPPDSLYVDQAIGKQVFDTIMNGENWQSEVKMFKKGGTILDILLRAYAIKNQDGRVISLVGLHTDITDRKQAEREILRQRIFLRQVIDLIPSLLYVKDMEGRYLMANKALADAYGITPDLIVGKTDLDLGATTEQNAGFRRDDNEVISTGQRKFIAEEPFTGQAGHVHFYQTTKLPLTDNRGLNISVLGVSVDITERKRVEQTLRESDNKFSAAFRYSPVGLTITSFKDGKYLDVNESYCMLSGFSKEELIGRNIFDQSISIWYNPKDAVHLRDILLQKGAVNNFDVRFHRKSGEVGWGILSATILDIAGEKFIISQTMDVTERKQAEDALRNSEARYRGIIENMLDIYYRSDREGNAIMISPSGVKLLGYDSEDDFIGKNIADHTYFDPGERNRMMSILREKGSVTDYEVTLKHKDGHPIPVSTSSRYYYDEQGNILGVEGMFRDIRQHKQEEEEKRNLEERLNRAEKMESLGILAGGVAHDLNNVLGIVVGYAEMLLMDADKTSEIRPRLAKIMEGGQKAAAIVQDMLTLARRSVPTSQVLNLNKIITDCHHSAEFENLLSYHPSVQLKTDLEPDLLNIEGSSVHLGKTIFNLVSNASEAMPKGGIVTIQTANQYLDKQIQGYDEIKEGDYVVFSVSDTGEGISASDLKRIFEPFYTKKVMGRSGTGLGLSVVWGTVKDHKGYINAESTEDKGSIFTLYFPASREDIPAEAVAISISEYMGHGESILIVDDVVGQRDLAAGMLRKLNYSVASVESGKEAIAYLKDHHVDLMVLDMIMDPGMDGLDTYRNVLEIHPKQKAIIVSGFSESDRVKATQSLGAGAYVRKPYVMEKLGWAVRKELDRPAYDKGSKSA